MESLRLSKEEAKANLKSYTPRVKSMDVKQPTSLDRDILLTSDKDAMYSIEKKRIAEKLKLENQVNQLKIDSFNKPEEPTPTGHNPNTNPESNGSRAEVEVYFCTDSWASESSFNICGADGCVWDDGYGGGYYAETEKAQLFYLDPGPFR